MEDATKKKQPDNSSKLYAAIDTIHRPKTDIQVNKKFDDKGNLIQYDSTYSYFYSSPNSRFNNINSDSVFKNFNEPFGNNFNDLFDENMNSIFFNDSLFKYDFYNKDYFSKRFQLNMRRFENMFKEMDSLKSDWLNQTYPQGNIKKN